MKKENLLPREEMKKVLWGDELRKLRNEECYSQEYMTKQLGLTQSTYQRLESGEIKISLERLIKITEIFDRPIEAFSRNSEETHSLSKETINNEIELLHKIILQQEKRIEELENKVKRKNDKIETLKLKLTPKN